MVGADDAVAADLEGLAGVRGRLDALEYERSTSGDALPLLRLT